MIAEYSPGIREVISTLLSYFDGDELAIFEDKIDLTSDESCFYSILHFAIECRGHGEIAKSLLVLNCLLELGVSHPLILDNKIRALIDDHRFLEALALLPSLSVFSEVEIYKGVVECLLPHQQSLLESLRSHCVLLQGDAYTNYQLPDLSSDNFLLEVLRFSIRIQEIGNVSTALALLQELMQWGVWSLDALGKDAQVLWSVLVIRLGSDVLSDLSLYHQALTCLNATQDTTAIWELAKVNFNIQCDRSQADRALFSVLEFIAAHPNHNASRAWLVDQQTLPDRTTMRKSDAAKVKEIDQSIAFDSLLIDYFLKLNRCF